MAVVRTETITEPEFALEQLAVENGQVVVRGRWYGVVGRRFVRPALRLDGQRRVIATLEHKPWAAVEGEPWIAAFPHSGDAFATAALDVAPDVSVEIKSAPKKARKPRAKAKPKAKPRAASTAACIVVDILLNASATELAFPG